MSLPAGHCGVCRQPFGAAPVRLCPKCRTPYHPECWTYNDRRCAVYACTPLRGPLRVLRGRGLSRGDSVAALLSALAILGLLVYWWKYF